MAITFKSNGNDFKTYLIARSLGILMATFIPDKKAGFKLESRHAIIQYTHLCHNFNMNF